MPRFAPGEAGDEAVRVARFLLPPFLLAPSRRIGGDAGHRRDAYRSGLLAGGAGASGVVGTDFRFEHALPRDREIVKTVEFNPAPAPPGC